MRLLGLLVIAAILGAPPSLAQEAAMEEEVQDALDLSAPANGWPATDALIENVYGRERVALSGPWAYTIDPFNVPTRKPRGRRNFWEDRTELPDGSLLEYAWDGMPTMDLPGDWNSRDAALTHYEGVAWFRRTFQAALEAGERRILYFEAVNYRARVWLNGELLGEHEGGFTPFAFEVTDRLREGGNSLVVRVDSQHDDETLPAADFDWKNYGGLTRPAHLVTVPDTYVRDYWVRLEDGVIVAEVHIDGGGAAAAEVAIPELGLSVEIPLDADGRGRGTLQPPQDLTLWSPQTPALYDVVVTAGRDRVADRIGFRTIEVDGLQVLLNGEPIWVRGISIHEEALGATGSRTLSWGEARGLLGEAKALGANFVRLAHYPHTERMTRLADEMGLMVWSEVPIYWEDVSYDSEKTLALARRMKAANVARDLNRASIIVWSVANETPVEPDRTAFLRTLIRDVRARDATRLVSAALNKNTVVGGPPGEPKRVVIDDPLGEDLDLIAVNQYEAWYGPRTPDEIAEVTFENTYDKPLLFSEFGAGIRVGVYEPADAYYTEPYGVELYRRTLEMVERTPGVVGTSPWILKDFQSPRRWHPQQGLWNRKGLISETGERKQAFFVLQDYYRRKAAELGAD